MLQHGVAVNGRNQWGFTPLHWAASEGHKEVRPRSPESSARQTNESNSAPEIPSPRPVPSGRSVGATRACLPRM